MHTKATDAATITAKMVPGNKVFHGHVTLTWCDGLQIRIFVNVYALVTLFVFESAVDLHIANIRARLSTMAGMFATTTPRNDGSAGVGQWNLNDAYKYFSEALGRLHLSPTVGRSEGRI